MFICNIKSILIMKIEELQQKAEKIIDDIKNKGLYLKENTLIDYKLELKVSDKENEVTIFLRNFAKDILAFANNEGGMLFLGFKEDRSTGIIYDVGLNVDSIRILDKIDLKELSDQFIKIFDNSVIIDVKSFQIAARKFYYVLVEKHNSVLIPKIDKPDFDIKKGDVIYRRSANNEKANNSTSHFNNFLEMKANEKNREFIHIWSNLLPEMFDINPREILIINPSIGRVYGYNSKNNVLSSTDVEVDNTKDGPINVILNAISAGEIGRISPDEGKPIYKLIGEIVAKKEKTKESTSITSVNSQLNLKSKYKISHTQLKMIMYHLRWVTTKTFNIENPIDDVINPEFSEFIWIETTDDLKKTKKVVFSPNVVDKLLDVTENEDSHIGIFGAMLKKKAM